MSKKILILNFGSTSTKVAVYDDLELCEEDSIRHPVNELNKFENIFDQSEYRKQHVLNFLNESNFNLDSFDCIISRGGLWKPLPSGLLVITETIIKDLESGKWGIHPSGLGCKIAFELGKEYNLPAISADSPTTDEFGTYARYSGIKDFERISLLHALNQKATGQRFSEENKLSYDDLNLIIIHLGGGISVVAHKKGRMIDSNNALEDGPFSPERSGSLPTGKLVDMCFSGDYTEKEIKRKLVGEGGLLSYLGTNDGIEVMDRIESGDREAKEVFEAMAYQVAKEVGAMATVLKGKVDAILFTGGLSYSDFLVDTIKERIQWIAPIHMYPGEDELETLAEYALKYLNNEEEALDYEAY